RSSSRRPHGSRDRSHRSAGTSGLVGTSRFRQLPDRNPGLLREGSELVVGHAALTGHAFAEGPDEVLLILLRTRFGKVLDQRDEPENLIRCRLGTIGPQLFRDRERPRVLPEDERPLPSDPLRLNRLVGRGVFDHTVRVDPRFVGERVVANERLRDPDRDAAQPFDELGELVQTGDFDPRVVFVQGLEREDELLELAFPDRSPSPFTQVWGTWTPSSTAARLFATARPKSLCPWNESSVGTSRSFSCPKNQRIPGGVITPTVSQTTARCAPAFVHALYRSTTKSRSARNVSSVTNETST